MLTSPPSLQFLQFLGRQHRLQLGRRLAGLRAVRLVGDHREALALRRRQLRAPPPARRETSGSCRRRSSCRRRAPSASSPLLLPPSPLIVATTPVVRSKSKIASCSWVSITLRSETTRTVEQLLVLRVVQVGQEVRRPRDRVGLARAGRVLDQVLAARPFRQHGGLQLAGGVELVIAGEDELLDLLLLVLLRDEVAAEDFEPALALPDLLPEVAVGWPFGFSGLPAPPSSPLLKGRKRVAAPSSRVVIVDFAVADREMDQRAAREGQQRLRRSGPWAWDGGRSDTGRSAS